jgi:hypothetical protein
MTLIMLREPFRAKIRCPAIVESLESRRLFDVSIGAPAVTNVSRMSGDQAEPTISIDPLNPQVLFTASNNDGTSLVAGISTDGGHTWSARTFATGADGLPQACCDPSAAFDQFGNLFLVYLGEQSNQAELLLSTDGGATFTHVASLGMNVDQPTVATGHGSVWVAFEQDLSGSQPRDQAERSSSLPRYSGGGLGRGPADGDEISRPPPPPQLSPGVPEEGEMASLLLSRSRSLQRSRIAHPPHIPVRKAGAVAYGASVAALGIVGKFHSPLSLAAAQGQNIGDIAVGPAGQVLVAYQSEGMTAPSAIVVRRNAKGLRGHSFTAARQVASTNVTAFDPIPAQARRTIDASVGLAYDDSADAFAGRVYMVYTDAAPPNSADTDIFLRFSDDDGLTWSTPLRVNDDSTTSSQFFPSVAVDPTSGALAVTWYDARNDSGVSPAGADAVANDDVQVYGAVAIPTATGVSFGPNFAITTGFSNTSIPADANDFGDYASVAFDAGTIAPAWADNSNSTGDNPQGAGSGLDLYTAQVPVSNSAQPTRTLIGQFGAVGGKLAILVGQSKVSLALHGGQGAAFINGNTLELSLTNTTARSSLSIGGSAILGNISAAGPIKTISARRCDLAGTLSVSGAVSHLTLHAITTGQLAATEGIGKISLLAHTL